MQNRIAPKLLALALIAVTLTIAAHAMSAEQSEASRAPAIETTERSVNFGGLLDLGHEAHAYREGRLVDLATFNQMSKAENTIILDTRSARAFAIGHIGGAVHLNFSDITELALSDAIPSRDTRILIYCNNNFTDNVEPVVVKSPPLALNLPTFITLYGYGYKNIYELGERIEMKDPRLGWVSGDGADLPLPVSLEEN